MEMNETHDNTQQGGEMPACDGTEMNIASENENIESAEAVNAEAQDGIAVNTATGKTKKERKPVKVSLGVLILAVLLTGLLVFQVTFVPLSLAYKREVELARGDLKPYPKLTEVMDIFKGQYIYDLDYEQLDSALSMMYIAASGDPHCIYYTAEEWEEQTAQSAGNGVGIGVFIAPEKDGHIVITQVMQDSPASRAGLKSGDIIIAVDGHKVQNLSSNATASLVKGEIGSTVMLDIVREGESMKVPVIRGTYSYETVFEKRVEKDGKTYAVICLTEFAQNTVASFKNAVNTALADEVEGIIFDLRDNGGGEVHAACQILDFLLPEGPIVHFWDAEGKETRVVYSDRSFVDAKMAVLVNNGTTSSAELFTSALMDYEKATVVGTKTYGKGCGQNGYVLSDGSVLFITSFYYTPPFSENYDGIGITPHIEIELPESEQDKSILLVKPENDTQLSAAIAALENTNK